VRQLRLTIFLLAWVFFGRALLAEEGAPMLKVSPVGDRQIEGKTNSVDAKDATPPVVSADVVPETGKKDDSAPQETEGDGFADAATPDDIVPAPFPVSRYESLWENSPFQIESIAPPQQSEGLGQRFVLGGILRENGEPVVWVRERATQQSYQVRRNATNNLGLSLVEVQESMEKQSEASATVRLGNEQGVIKFDTAGGSVPGVGMASPAMARPAVPVPLRTPQTGMPVAAPNQSVPGGVAVPNMPATTSVPAVSQPGVVPPVPGPPVPPDGQVQAPGQEQMPPPRVIRRRAIVPAAPSAP